MEDPPLRHAAQEQIEDAAKVLVEVVARQTQGEQPMQRQGVELVLQVVAMLHHGLLQRRPAVVGRAHAEVVGFVVEQIPAPLPLEHQVDKALEHPLHGGEAERLVAPRQGVVLLAKRGQRRCRHPPHGQEELQLHLLALGDQIPQP